jgi:hypothetical protein
MVQMQRLRMRLHLYVCSLDRRNQEGLMNRNLSPEKEKAEHLLL